MYNRKKYYLVTVNVDGADVSSSYSCHTEEAVFPLTNIHHSLVQAEQFWYPASYRGIHT